MIFASFDGLHWNYSLGTGTKLEKFEEQPGYILEDAVEAAGIFYWRGIKVQEERNYRRVIA